MALLNVKLGNKFNRRTDEHLFENYAAIVTGSSFVRHAALKFEGTFEDMHCFIVDAAKDDEHIEEFTHDKIKCATILGAGEVYVSVNSTEVKPCSVMKYLVVFNDGRQAILTSRLAESGFAIERILF